MTDAKNLDQYSEWFSTFETLVRKVVKKEMQNNEEVEVEGFKDYIERLKLGKVKIAQTLGINFRTLELRLKNPASFSLEEIEKLAEYLRFTKNYVQKMIEKDIENERKQKAEGTKQP